MNGLVTHRILEFVFFLYVCYMNIFFLYVCYMHKKRLTNLFNMNVLNGLSIKNASQANSFKLLHVLS